MLISEIINPTITAYHGTGRDFKVFAYMPAIRKSTSLGGFCFTTNVNQAVSYATSAAKITNGKPRIITVQLTMHHPLDITSTMAKLVKKMSFGDAKRKALEQYDPQIYDGIMFRGNSKNSDEYIVFHPEQIKIVPNNFNKS